MTSSVRVENSCEVAELNVFASEIMTTRRQMMSDMQLLMSDMSDERIDFERIPSMSGYTAENSTRKYTEASST